MTAEEIWLASGLEGEYEAWSFGGDPDGLAALVFSGKKTATASAFPCYEEEGEPLPEPGEYSVILDSRDEAICIIKTTKVYITPFNEVTERHARMEGEGDLSLKYWREVHRDFFIGELAEIGRSFTEDMPVVCEEFERAYP